MKLFSAITLLFTSTFIFSQGSEIKGMALKCNAYTVQTTNLEDQSRSAKDTIKKDVIVAINTAQSFIYLKGIDRDYIKNYYFKEIKTTEFVKTEGVDNLGYRTRKSFYFSFPYLADENVTTNFASITYNLLQKRIEFSITIKNKDKKESKTYKFFVNGSTYFDWSHGLVFEKVTAIDKIQMHENDKKISEQIVKGSIIVNDTSVTIKLPKTTISKSYTKSSNSTKYLNYVGPGFLLSFSNQLYTDPWTVYFYDYDKEQKKFAKAIFLQAKQ